ncbi:MAG TPA: TetR/AcrR family transcriptional regulator, partial [Alcanivorax sp.]|nr:TetR/AcrR family transcriptional regulator [Alcanivorax sp.]
MTTASQTSAAQAPAASGGPGAPKTARGARTRARILKAAEHTFGTLGYHRAGISDITRAAGVAQGTFYTYFAGKEEILRELVRDMGHQVRAHLAAEILDTDNRLEAEERGLRAFLQYLYENPSLYRVLQEAQFVDEAIYRDYYEAFGKGYVRMLANA